MQLTHILYVAGNKLHAAYKIRMNNKVWFYAIKSGILCAEMIQSKQIVITKCNKIRNLTSVKSKYVFSDNKIFYGNKLKATHVIYDDAISKLFEL